MAGHCRHGEGQGLVKARAVYFVLHGGSRCGRSTSSRRPRGTSSWPPSGRGSRAGPSCSPTGARSIRTCRSTKLPRRPGGHVRLPVPLRLQRGRPRGPPRRILAGGPVGLCLPPPPGPVHGRCQGGCSGGGDGCPPGHHVPDGSRPPSRYAWMPVPAWGRWSAVGLGAVGILVAALLARTGTVVLGSEPVPARRSAADTFGVRALAIDDVADAVSETTEGAELISWSRPWEPQACLRPWGCWREVTAVVCSWYGTTRPRSLWGPRFTADGWPSAAPRSPASQPPSARVGPEPSPRSPGGSHASRRSPPSAPMHSRSKRPPRPTPTDRRRTA